MALSRDSRINSVGVKGRKNKETVTASLCLVFTALLASVAAAPDWSNEQ